MANQQSRVTHHVVEYAAPLEVALPEPRPMRPTVLFGGTGEVRSPGERGAAGPEDGATVLDLRREDLILEVPVIECGSLHESGDVHRLRDIAGQRLLARDAHEPPESVLHGVDDGLDILHPGKVRPA